MNAKFVEWSGAILGLIGSLLLALRLDISGFGFKNRAWGLVTMQAGFTATSIMGIYNWFGKPALSIAGI
jgi:hypothetical protein